MITKRRIQRILTVLLLSVTTIGYFSRVTYLPPREGKASVQYQLNDLDSGKAD
ncbi:hypothetical protein [Streptococcus suis]|uniref:hypothetical protein n=1 Tax=Streptococcus suis TaxID=1307 RepID=UPI0038B7CB0B